MSVQQSFMIPGRTLVWFSCGAASAVAAKIAIEQYGKTGEVEVCYCDTLAYEHPDNYRFMADVEQWIGQPIKILGHKRFQHIFDVFEVYKFVKGPTGAPCTLELKKRVREEYSERWDIHVFGFTADEHKRIDRFVADNPELRLRWPLLERQINKGDCFSLLKHAEIKLPHMYRLGYKNNNCIGCVKGGAGYWNKIRKNFPYVFDQMARKERELGFALLRVQGKPCFLDELPRNVGRYESEPDMSCGPVCVMPTP